MQDKQPIIDTRRPIQTPEGVELGLRVSGPIPRAYAWLIDFLIRGGIYFVLGMVLSFFGNFGMGIFLIAIFLLEWFYPVIFEVYKQGATPGKRSAGIKVVNDDGSEVTLQSSLIRNLLRGVDFLPFMYGFGVITMLCNREFKRLGDFAAGTIVVYQDKLKVTEPVVQEAPKTPPLSLLPVEQRAVIQFAERLNSFTPERCGELANILTDITKVEDALAVKRILQYANWLLGRQ